MFPFNPVITLLILCAFLYTVPMPFINYFLIPFILLIILILVHELGHFIAAKKSGVYVEEFGFGIPPRAFGIKWGETLYSINWLPIGGFVRLFGEEGEHSAKTKDGPALMRAFYKQPTWRKSLIVTAGVIMNLILAVVVFSGVYSITGIPESADGLVQIVQVAKNSPAEEAGLQMGDIVHQISLTPPDGETVTTPVSTSQEFIDATNEHVGQTVNLHIERYTDAQITKTLNPDGTFTRNSGEQLILPALIRSEPPADEGPLGVVIAAASESVFYPWWQMPFRGTWAGIEEALAWMSLILVVLGQMIAALFTKGAAPEVGGPVEIFRAGGQIAQLGLIPTLRFMGVLSVNLAVLNILPFPALDGGRLVFILWEGITGKKVSSRIEHSIHNIGFAILISLIILITFNDLRRIFGS